MSKKLDLATDSTTPLVKLNVENTEVTCFVDSGSSVTIIKNSLAQHFIKNGHHLRKCNKIIQSVNGTEISTEGIIDLSFTFSNNKQVTHSVIVCDNATFPGALLLGQDFLKRVDGTVSFCKNKIGYLSIYGKRFPFFKSCTDSTFTSICAVKIDDLYERTFSVGRTPSNMCIGASTAQQYYLKVPRHLNGKTVIAVPCKSLANVIMPRTVAHVENGKIPITFINCGDHNVKIPPNTIAAIVDIAKEDTPTTDPVCNISENDSYDNRNANVKQDLYNPVPRKIPCSEPEFEDILNNINVNHLSIDRRAQLITLLRKHRSAVAVGDEIGHIKETQHHIDVGAHNPINTPQYRIPHSTKAIIDNHVEKMLQQGIIEPCKSPWSSPVILIKKPDGSYRFCVDYRQINSITKKDVFPIPRIDETLESLKGAAIFTTLDMKSSFWQVELDEQSRDITAFKTNTGSYRFIRTPFGLVNSPSVWQRACNLAFSKYLSKFVYAYIDDLVVFSQNFEEHMGHLDAILRQVTDSGLKLGLSKCQFAANSVKYLGHIVDQSGIKPDPIKIKALSEVSPPNTVRRVRQFLGAAGYYRKFIRNYSAIAAPLTALTKKATIFRWTDEHQTAFDTLKNKLVTAPVLKYPDYDKAFILHTDASKLAIGAVLNQPHHAGEHPIAFFSRKLRGKEIFLSVCEKEALAIYESIKFFTPYLYGYKFEVVTDHAPLRYIFKHKNSVPQIARWAIFLSEYDFTIRYKEGKTHVVPDYLSRNDAVCVVTNTENDERKENEENEKSQGLTTSIIRECQRSDPYWGGHIEFLEGNRQQPNKRLNAEEFFLEDGVLCRLPSSRRRHGRTNVQIVIPKQLVQAALQKCHDDAISCHMGFFRTLERSRDHFFWYHQVADTKRYVNNCMPCQKRRWQGKLKGDLGEFPPTSHPLERVGVDLIELPTSYSGNKYALTIVDHFSRYVNAIPIPNKTAETVTKAMVTFIAENSVPEQIVSDRGSEFTNDLFQEVCRRLQAKSNLTTAYHPMSNGLVEKNNSTIKKALSHLSGNDQFTWDESLPFVTLAINTAFQTRILDVPFFLFHGRDANLPYAEVMGKPQINYSCDTNYAAEMTLRLNKAFTLVTQNSKISHDKSAQYYNKTANHRVIAPGSLVLLRNETNKRDSLSSWPTNFIGPYRVISRSNNNYKIKGVYADRKEQTVHVNRLKIAHLRPDTAFPFNNHTPSQKEDHNAQTSPAPMTGHSSGTEVQAVQQPTPRYNLRSRGPKSTAGVDLV